MGTALRCQDLLSVDLGRLGDAVDDWKRAVRDLGKQEKNAHDGLIRASESARWAGVNATVTREFVGKTAKEIGDLHREARSIWAVLDDAHTELVSIQRQFRSLVDAAGKHDPQLVVTDGSAGAVKVMAMCDTAGKESTQPVRDLVKWYADTLTGLLSHASEVSSFAVTALRRSHGGDPMDPGHADYRSLDDVMLPRAVELAKLGKKATWAQRMEIRNLWQSLGPTARAELWQRHRDDLLAAGLLSPTVKQVSADEGAGPWGVRDPGLADYRTKAMLEMLANGADMKGMTDAARHMAHYLDDSGTVMDLPVDKMMHDDPGFQHAMDEQVRTHADSWRSKALEAYRQGGGRPVTIPVETANRGYSFPAEGQPNWFYAVGSTNSNLTGAVTVAPGADGKPKVSLDYQVNAWDRYNWDVHQNKSVSIAGHTVMDGNQAKLHEAGLAKEFDMRGSSSVKHMDLSSGVGTAPQPDEPGWRDSRADPGRKSAGR
ncbi:hypothetical protein [Streptomyces sp. NPDC050560]|uniref:hypothetical protein n=1 Tax=Streptomyces sp. NPDC050560 TaxID=3365630 RepID=UPI0037A573E0